MKIFSFLKNYFTKTEIFIWFTSVILILISNLFLDKIEYIKLIASLIGVTSLIFCAKGNPFGQVLMIIFSLQYGAISYSFKYYGEMITYLGMSAPMAVLALISWLKNPYKGQKSQVEINTITFKETLFMIFLTTIVTIAFYYILKYFNTSNLIPSTFSVTTSFMAVYLTFRRSPYYALAYAFNDIVLIILWVLASINDASYISVVICFIVFLINDIYGFYNWKRMQKRQAKM